MAEIPFRRPKNKSVANRSIAKPSEKYICYPFNLNAAIKQTSATVSLAQKFVVRFHEVFSQGGSAGRCGIVFFRYS